MSSNDSSTDKFTVRFELDKSRLVEEFGEIRKLVSDTFRTPAILASQLGAGGVAPPQGTGEANIYITGTAADRPQIQKVGAGKFFISIGGKGTQYGELLDDDTEEATKPTDDDIYGKDPRKQQPAWVTGDISPFGGATYGLPPGEHSQIRDILDWIEDVQHTTQGTLKFLAKTEGGVMQKGEPGSVTEYRMKGIIRAVTKVQEVTKLLITRGLIQETQLLSEVKDLTFGEEGDYARLSSIAKVLGNTVQALTYASFTSQRGVQLESSMKEIMNDLMRMFVGGGEGVSHKVEKNISEYIYETLGFTKFSTATGLGDIRREFEIGEEPGRLDIGVTTTIQDYFKGGVFKHSLIEQKSATAGSLKDARQLVMYMGSSIPVFLKGLQEIMEVEDNPDMSRISARMGLAAKEINPSDKFRTLMQREWVRIIEEARTKGFGEQLDIMGWDETTLNDYLEFIPLKGITKPEDILTVLGMTGDVTPSNIVSEMTKLALGRLQPGSSQLVAEQPKYNPRKWPLKTSLGKSVKENIKARAEKHKPGYFAQSFGKSLKFGDVRDYLKPSLPDVPVQAPLIATTARGVAAVDSWNKDVFTTLRKFELSTPAVQNKDKSQHDWKVSLFQAILQRDLKLPAGLAMAKAQEYVTASEYSDEAFASWYKDKTGDDFVDSTRTDLPAVTQPTTAQAPAMTVHQTFLTSPEPTPEPTRQAPVTPPTPRTQQQLQERKKNILFTYLSRMGPGGRSEAEIEQQLWNHPYYWIGYIRKGESRASSGIQGISKRQEELELFSHKELQLVLGMLGLPRGGSKADLQNRIINSYNRGTPDFVPLPDTEGELAEGTIVDAMRAMIAGDDLNIDDWYKQMSNFYTLGRAKGSYLESDENYQLFMMGREGEAANTFSAFATGAESQMRKMMRTLSGDDPRKLPFTSVNQPLNIFNQWRNILTRDDSDVLDEIDELETTIKSQLGQDQNVRNNMLNTLREAKSKVFGKLTREIGVGGQALYATIGAVPPAKRAQALYGILKTSPAGAFEFLKETQGLQGSADFIPEGSIWEGIAVTYKDANDILTQLVENMKNEKDTTLTDVFNNMRQLQDKELNLQIATSVPVWYGLGNGQ